MSTPPEPDGEVTYFVAPDGYGDPTIWRHRPGRDPVAVMTRTPATAEVFLLASHGLEVRP